MAKLNATLARSVVRRPQFAPGEDFPRREHRLDEPDPAEAGQYDLSKMLDDILTRHFILIDRIRMAG